MKRGICIGLKAFIAICLWSPSLWAAQQLSFEKDLNTRHSKLQQILLPPITGRPSHLRLEYSLKAERPHYFELGWRDLQGQVFQQQVFLKPAEKQTLILPISEAVSGLSSSQVHDPLNLYIQLKESEFLSHLPYDAAKLTLHQLAWHLPQKGIQKFRISPQENPAELQINAQSELKSFWQLKVYQGKELIFDWPLPEHYPSTRAQWLLTLPHAGLYRIEVQAHRRKAQAENLQVHSYSQELPYFLQQDVPRQLKVQLFSADQRLNPLNSGFSDSEFRAQFASVSDQYLTFQLALQAQGVTGETELDITLKNWRKEKQILHLPPMTLQLYRGGFVYTVAPERYYSPQSEGYHADPLFPLDASEKKRLRLSHQREFLYYELYAPADLPAGKYSADLVLEWQGQTQHIPLHFEHYQIQAKTKMKTAISLYPDALAKHYPQNTEKFKQQATQLLWQHGISPDHLYLKQPLRIADIKANEALTQGQSWHNLLYWDSQTLEHWPQIKPQLDQSVAYIRKHHLSSHYYFFVFDEARQEKLPQFQRAMQIIKRDYPEFMTLSTSRVFRDLPESLLPEIDEWVPVTQELDYLQRPGQPFRWWYQLLVNHEPFANWFLESPLIDTRLLFWQAWLYQIEGLLYYSANRWFSHPRPLQGADFPYTSWNPRAFPDTNGDGYLIYPGPEVLASLRLKAFRAGQQDYALLNAAEKKLGRQVIENKVRALIQDLSHFDRRPQKLKQIRTEILELMTQD